MPIPDPIVMETWNGMRGSYRDEAATELLDRAGLIYEGVPWIVWDRTGWTPDSNGGRLRIDSDVLRAAPGTSGHGVAQIVAALLDGSPTIPLTALASLEPEHRKYVVVAIAYAAGVPEFLTYSPGEGCPCCGGALPAVLQDWMDFCGQCAYMLRVDSEERASRASERAYEADADVREIAQEWPDDLRE